MADPTFRDYDMLSLVLEMDPDHYERDIAYEFSNSREFVDTDNTDSGIYDGS
jgi:hypothetical protein